MNGKQKLNLPKIRPSRQFLFELIFNGMAPTRIAYLTGWSVSYIRRLIEKLGLPSTREFKKELREMWKDKIAVEYMRLSGINDISTSTPFDWKVVTSILQDMGILTDLHLGSHVMKKYVSNLDGSLSQHISNKY
ncbi:MAG: hypothetical protein ACFFBD_22985 [Candidatus Hodarchaeota archaeon]